MNTQTVIRCLDLFLTFCETAFFVLFGNASSVSSLKLKAYLTQPNIASSTGNGRAKRTIQTVWKTIQFAQKLLIYLTNNKNDAA